jgi:photosystem II stability/assembly factor-like uncharacterized protein
MRTAFWLLMLHSILPAQWTLYTCMATSKNYVVGARLPPSGVFRRDPAGAWRQAGFNHPFTFSLSYSKDNPAVLYLAAGNGLIRLSERGTKWRILTGSDVTELRDVSMAPDGAIWYGHTAGIRVSRDAGMTWTEMSGDLPRKYTEAIRVDRTKAGTIVAGGEDGLWRSEDAGATWKLAGAAGWQIMAIEQSPHDPCLWLAASQNGGLFVSRDCGRSFENSGRLGFGRVLYSIAFDASEPKRIAVAGWGFGVAVTDDAGKTWEFRNAGLPSTDVWSVGFDPSKPGRLFASLHEEAVFRSEDAGKAWTRDGLEGSYVTRMVFVREARP